MSANGRLTDAELRVVEDNDRLSTATANAFFRARDAWYAEGGSGACIVEPAGAYRDYETQRAMKYGIPSYDYWNLNPNSKAGLASPGSSTHGTGTRFDATGRFNSFLLRRGWQFGFSREFGANDPNHWKHNGYTAAEVYEAAPITRPTTPEPEPEPDHSEETEMLNLTALLKIVDGQNRLGGGKDRVFWYLVDPSGWVRIASDQSNDSELANYWSVRLGNVAAPNLGYGDIEVAVASAGHATGDLFKPAVQFYRNPAAS